MVTFLTLTLAQRDTGRRSNSSTYLLPSMCSYTDITGRVGAPAMRSMMGFAQDFSPGNRLHLSIRQGKRQLPASKSQDLIIAL